jgi:hypothetical protein
LKAAYLTTSILNVFDRVERKDPDYLRIITGLQNSFSKSVSQRDRILLDAGSLNLENLKELLGDLVPDDKLKKFVKDCRKEMGLEKEDDEMGYQKRQAENQMDEEKDKKLIKFTDDFWMMLDKIRPGGDVVWDLYSLDSNPEIKNPMGIEKVDVSDREWYFEIFSKGKSGQMKATQFIKHFFPKINSDDVGDFVAKYNRLISGTSKKPTKGVRITPRKFKLDPTNVRETFISLVTETYPMGHEEEVVEFLPENLERDKHGNYYAVIGDSDTVFTCHLDTASRTKSKVRLVSYDKDNQSFIKTDETTILGADDKSGVAVLMYMMAKGVPGVYWFFMGEERGGIGSGKVAGDFDSYPFMQGKKKMISFDRRNYYSVITEQMGVTCCSNEFAESLCKELNKSGLKLNLDPTGVFTDSANFIDLIPECTNVSVGYFNEHTHNEIQNITYLEQLAEACVAVEWENLDVSRKIGFDEEVARKYNRMIKSFKKTFLYNNESIKGNDGRLLIELEISDLSLDHLYKDLLNLQKLFTQHKIDPDINFHEDTIKIELE